MSDRGPDKSCASCYYRWGDVTSTIVCVNEESPHYNQHIAGCRTRICNAWKASKEHDV